MHEWIDLRFEISSRPQHDIRIVLKGARVEPTLWQLISGSQGRGFGGGENSLEKERAHRYICPCHAPHFFSQCGAVLQSVAETPPQSIEGFCRVWPNASSHDVVVKVAFDSWRSLAFHSATSQGGHFLHRRMPPFFLRVSSGMTMLRRRSGGIWKDFCNPYVPLAINCRSVITGLIAWMPVPPRILQAIRPSH